MATCWLLPLQTGKSYTQCYLLPALVADSLRRGELKGPTPVLLQLDGSRLDMRVSTSRPKLHDKHCASYHHINISS